MNSNNLINDNTNMTDTLSKIKLELEEEIKTKGKQDYHPKLLFKKGKYTKKLLAYNRKLLKEGKITTYLDTTKFYNVDTNRLNKIPKQTKGFNDKFNVIGQVYSKKKATNDFRYVVSQSDIDGISWANNSWTNDDSLNNNNLVKNIIRDNGFIGNYRILIKRDGTIILDNNFNIISANNFWKNNEIQFQDTSEYMKWNNNLTIGEVITFIFTKEKKLTQEFYKQKFLDGKVSHCLLQPILNWAYNVIETTKSKIVIANYSTIINKLNGNNPIDKRTKKKIGYLEKYQDGIPEEELGMLCEDLQIGMDIDQPFSKTLLFEYRSMKKPRKVFKYVNTRINHVEFTNSTSKNINENSIFKTFEPEYVDSLIQLIEIQSALDKDDSFYVYSKNAYGINSIQTLDRFIKIKSDFSDHVKDWEKDTGLKYCSIDALKYPELQKFINLGTHFNGTIDFKDTKKFKKNREGVRHIDMKKAYTQFAQYKNYDGFCLKISDFRKCDRIISNGFYYINNINLDKCEDKFKKLINDLGWFWDNNVYTKEELEALTSYGGTYDILYGAWGKSEDFEFDDDMLNEKDTVVFNDKEISIPYYSKWAGMNCMIHSKKNFWIKGKSQYFENIPTDTDIFFADDEARISYSTSYQYNKKHITAQITAYQRLQMLDQLMEMDYSKLIRICCDGIYFEDHEFNMDSVFSYKQKMTFNNDPCESYLSGIIGTFENAGFTETINEFREHYDSQIFDGAGGDGKTYGNLFIDTGFINVVYCGHSNKLQTSVSNQYFEHFGKKLATTNHYRLLNEPFSTVEGEVYKHSVYIIDECSMLTENSKEYLLKNIRGKIIFCGDLKCQCEPIFKKEGQEEYIDKPEAKIQMTYKGIKNIADQSPKNYRFKDSKQLAACNYIRNRIINDKEHNIYKSDIDKLQYQRVDKQFVKNNYSKEDIILVSQHKFNDEWTEVFKDIEKYKVINNTRDYKNGDIIFEEINQVKTELRHGFTVHSVQGETFKHKIFIDTRGIRNLKVLYTAISRAEYSSQIYIVS